MKISVIESPDFDKYHRPELRPSPAVFLSSKHVPFIYDVNSTHPSFSSGLIIWYSAFEILLAVIAPKFEELSDTYPDAVFLKVIGDATPDASNLMKREGVRSVPSFHYFKDGERVSVVNGANAEAIESAIKEFS